MYTTIIAILMALFPPVFDSAQSACDSQPLTPATSQVSVLQAFGGRVETWLRLQVVYDLAQLRKEADKIKVRRLA